MKQDALKYFTETHLTVLGLVIFFAFFVSVVVWTYRKQSKSLYPRMTQMPLQNDGESL